MKLNLGHRRSASRTTFLMLGSVNDQTKPADVLNLIGVFSVPQEVWAS
jgi:hypothetical protein